MCPHLSLSRELGFYSQFLQLPSTVQAPLSLILGRTLASIPILQMSKWILRRVIRMPKFRAKMLSRSAWHFFTAL